jgi:hypothetical protein
MQPSTSSLSEQNEHVQAYLASLSPKETKAYHIAKSHLGTSFDLEKSVGYLAFLKAQAAATAASKAAVPTTPSNP